ncbi:MAG: YtxH domain-containing protein [Anaerolineales bacterium]|jgi:gas vesicle protein
MENGNRSSSAAGSFLLGSLIGGAAGYIAALLLAPRSGEETQAEILAQARALRDRANEAVLEGRRSLEEQVGRGRHTVAEWLEQGSELLDDRAKELAS